MAGNVILIAGYLLCHEVCMAGNVILIAGYLLRHEVCMAGNVILIAGYLLRHKVCMAGNVLMLATVHRIVPVSVCLQILNSFSISGMDEAMLFKFGKWV